MSDLKQIMFQARKTILEMLIDRKYDISSELLDLNYLDFITLYDNNEYDFNVSHKTEKHNIYIKFYNEAKNLGKKELTIIYKEIFDKIKINDPYIIIVVRDKPNTAVNTEMKKDIYDNVQIFEARKLQFNPTKHKILMPKSIEVLSNDEAEQVLKKYRATKTQFPKITKNDPLTKYYGAKSGQIFRFIRKSNSTGVSVGYRIVK